MPMYRYFTAKGANRQEALLPVICKALKSAFNPLIANKAVIGLIALPVTKTRQITGESSPKTGHSLTDPALTGIFYCSPGVGCSNHSI